MAVSQTADRSSNLLGVIMIKIRKSVLISLFEKYKNEMSPEDSSLLESYLLDERPYLEDRTKFSYRGNMEQAIQNLLNLDLTSEIESNGLVE